MISQAFIVLGHEIKFPSHALSDSSRARCSLLHNLVLSKIPDHYIVLFMGKGRLQRDCPLSISQCMHNYFSDVYFPPKNCYIDFNSLDTVGDAVYSHAFLLEHPYISEVNVITSDWHLSRVSSVFNTIYSSSQFKLSYFASEESSLMAPEALQLKKQTGLVYVIQRELNIRNC